MIGSSILFTKQFVKGNTKDNVMHDWNNTPTQQYVRSFFMDETEVTNAMYVEYLFWLKNMYGNDVDVADSDDGIEYYIVILDN